MIANLSTRHLFPRKPRPSTTYSLMRVRCSMLVCRLTETMCRRYIKLRQMPYNFLPHASLNLVSIADGFGQFFNPTLGGPQQWNDEDALSLD